MQFDFSSLKHPKGTFLEKPFHFDNTGFKIYESEAIAMDPQQRIMPELAIEAKENARISDFKNKNIDVYIGANQRAYTENITAGMFKKQLLDQVKKLNRLIKYDKSFYNLLNNPNRFISTLKSQCRTDF